MTVCLCDVSIAKPTKSDSVEVRSAAVRAMKSAVHKQVIRHLLFLTLLAIVNTGALARNESIILGVLEDVPEAYFGQGSSHKVRVLFKRKAAGWSAYKHSCGESYCLRTNTQNYPRQVAWFVGLEGKQIGKVVGRTPKKFQQYSHMGLQDVVGGKVPVIGVRSSEFGTFAADELYRPLVTVSKPYFNDPSLWKRIEETSEIRTQALEIFRTKIRLLCKLAPSDGPSVPFSYEEKDVSVRAHRSSSGLLIIGIQPDNGNHYCNRESDYSNPLTFGVNATGKALFLGAGLTFIDAGDYDSDGRSELIFLLSRYNEGGYVLFSDTFTELARFEFSYH